MDMLPSTIKKSVMAMQLSDFNDGSMPMEEASSKQSLYYIEAFQVVQKCLIYFYCHSSPTDLRSNCPVGNCNKISTEMF